MRYLSLLIVLLFSGLAHAGIPWPPGVWDPQAGEMVDWEDIGDAWDDADFDGQDPGDPGGGDPGNPGGLPTCDCTPGSTVEDPDAHDGGDCGDPVTVEDPDSIQGRSGQAYDNDGDGVPDCWKPDEEGDCPAGDEICECLAETTAELQAIKGVLEGFEGTNSLLNSFLNQMLEIEAPTVATPPPVQPLPALEGSLVLGFDGMPQHSVLNNLASQDAGLGDVSEIEQTPYSFGVKITEPGMVPVDVEINTATGSLLDGLGGHLDQVRVLFRGFLLCVLIYHVLNHVWGVLTNL